VYMAGLSALIQCKVCLRHRYNRLLTVDRGATKFTGSDSARLTSGSAAIPGLIELLGNKSSCVPYQAATELEVYGARAPTALPELTRLANAKGKDKQYAALQLKGPSLPVKAGAGPFRKNCLKQSNRPGQTLLTRQVIEFLKVIQARARKNSGDCRVFSWRSWERRV
jgi:hypothetical protein